MSHEFLRQNRATKMAFNNTTGEQKKKKYTKQNIGSTFLQTLKPEKNEKNKLMSLRDVCQHAKRATTLKQKIEITTCV
jgi:hypothetical protein